MPGRSLFSLVRIVEGLAPLSQPRHRELVRGMLAELESIGNPAERRRFALGAVAAIARLALSGSIRFILSSPGPMVPARELEVGPRLGGPWMSKPTTRQLLGRHAVPFLVSFVSLTALLLANNALQRVH